MPASTHFVKKSLVVYRHFYVFYCCIPLNSKKVYFIEKHKKNIPLTIKL
jgi:hypothetical protein